LVYKEREVEALRSVNEYFEANPNKFQAIILYGTNHSFDFYSDIFPKECISVPTEFQDVWKGRMRDGPHGFFVHRAKAKTENRAPKTNYIKRTN